MSNKPSDEREVTAWTPLMSGTGDGPDAEGARLGGAGTCNLCDETDGGHTGQCWVVS